MHKGREETGEHRFGERFGVKKKKKGLEEEMGNSGERLGWWIRGREDKKPVPLQSRWIPAR